MFSHSARKPSGTLIVTDPDLPQEVHQDTVQCGHCGRHWIVEKGSGKKRGFCLKCMRITCGNVRCDVCVPQEQQLEAMEAGIAWEDIPHQTFPTKVSFASPSGLLGPDGRPLQKEDWRDPDHGSAPDAQDLHPGQLPEPQ